MTVSANFKVQLDPSGPCRSHSGDYLSRFNGLPFRDQNPAVMGIGAEEMLVMIDDYEFPVTPQTVTGINHFAVGRCPDRFASLSGNVYSFVDFSGQ